MTYEEYKDVEPLHHFSQPLQTTDAERFNEMLEILPPINWERNNDFETFCMVDKEQGPFTRQFARLGGRYATRLVDLYNRSTYITRQELCQLKTGLIAREDEWQLYRDAPEAVQ